MKNILLSTLFLLFFFDLQAKIVYIEPVQNAKYVSINNNIIIGFDEIIESFDLSSVISVTGDLSGIHLGEIFLTTDKKKLIFQPFQPFALNESVEVKVKNLKTTSTSNNRLKYKFYTQVRKLDLDFRDSFMNEIGNSYYNIITDITNSDSLPSLTVNVSNNPSPGDIYLSNFPFTAIPNTPYLLNSNNDGIFSYTKEITTNRAVDFKKQPNGLLTYNTNGRFYAQDFQHNIVDTIKSGNGYSTDQHELLILNNGHYLLMSYDPEPVDMSLLVPGGDSNAIVTGLIIQELDENKNVVFQWRSWDHFNIIDAIHQDLTAATIDAVHGNAIEYDNDGNIMISSRHLDEITKINRTTGEIIWRLGGVNNQFTFVNDSIGFNYQHHIRRISNGNITLYDNGNFHSPQFSRALEYHLDEVNKIATLVWQYRNNPDIYGFAMGSVQRLQNGNTLISWGSTNPTMTEVTPTGDIALEMTLPSGIYTYRTFRDEVNLTLNAKIAIEGFYNDATDQLNMNDTVRAYIRSSSSPFGIIDSAKSVVDSVNFNGNFRFYNVPDGTYYVSTKHRNGLETWSKAGGEAFISGGVYQYDFTNSAANSYGSNAVLKGSKYCFYSGDVNQDGLINISDVLLISNDAADGVTGYVNTDVNGDNVVDLNDLLIAYNNAVNFVEIMTP